MQGAKLIPYSPSATKKRIFDEEELAKWLKGFVPKLKRTTTRNDCDRLILSVERSDFAEKYYGGWIKCIFNKRNEKGKVISETNTTNSWDLTHTQITILENNPQLDSIYIKRDSLRAENGDWKMEEMKKELNWISSGGEAIVLKELVCDMEVAVRVHPFDPNLFTEKANMDDYDFLPYFSEGIFVNI